MKHKHCIYPSQEPYGPDPNGEDWMKGEKLDKGTEKPPFEHQTFIEHEHKNGEIRHRHMTSTPLQEGLPLGAWKIHR